LHLPSGGNPSAARALLPDGLIGASAHSAEEASQLLAAGADYVTVSPVFMTVSKPGYGPVLGLEGLASVVAQAPGPVIALGGITAQNAGRCLAAGAHGVAIMGEAMRAADPRAAVMAILGAISGNNPGGELRRPKNALR
ncbi:MAG: thiamine phosphate synthase, partial [Stellaceae bacterium]